MKKGFFFSMDAFFAIMIFTLILVSIYGYFISTQELRQQYYFSEDLFDVFVNTKIEELNLNNEYLTGIKTLNNWGLTQNDLTIMEQVITFKNQGYSNYSSWILQNLTYKLFDRRYGFSFNIEDWMYGGEGGNITVARKRFVSGTNQTKG